MTPTKLERVRIGSRKSDLARLQAFRVGGALQKAHPKLKIEYHFKESLGDVNLSDPLWKMPEKGVFTQDFGEDLLTGRVDLVVHSWKDLPIEDRPGCKIAATLERADPRDVLLMKRDNFRGAGSYVSAVHAGILRILSSSPRREYNLKPFLKEALPHRFQSIEFQPVRGNVQTRVRKLLEGHANALIVAKAAIDRLLESEEKEFAESRDFLRRALSDKLKFMVLPLGINPSAAAQGALAIEICENRPELEALLGKIQVQDDFENVQSERHILKSYGGGCHQKIGVSILRRAFGRLLSLRGVTDQGKVLEQLEILNSETRMHRGVDPAQLWPKSPKEVQWFDREPIAARAPQGPKTALWVARAQAFPDSWLGPCREACVWTAGLETWKKLAARGVWVSGTAESLGERENPKLQNLAPGLKWHKLTHADGEEPSRDEAKKIATYRLVLRETGNFPDLREKTHFYWMSGSAFRLAAQVFPKAIAKGRHFCGPGHTSEIIQRELQRMGARFPVKIELDHSTWLKNTVAEHAFSADYRDT